MQKLSLAGTWQAAQVDGDQSLKATVPGEIFNDLLNAGIIDDPFYRDNELACEWVWRSAWVFSREFEVSSELLERDCVMLSCDGLDTLGKVCVNGSEIGRVDNKFRSWEWSVKDVLKAGTNKIEITFDSAANYCDSKDAERFLPGWSSHSCAKFGWARKQACDFGWDWGIKLPGCGIWRDINIVAFDTARLKDVRIDQNHNNGKVSLKVSAQLDRISDAELDLKVTASLDGKIVAEKQVACSADQDGLTRLDLEIADPQLWWPNGLGEHPLYDISVSLSDKDGGELDADSKRVGLRTLVLDRHADQWGESFQFVVNGVPFFAKGANWIPVDGVMGRRTDEDFYRLVADSARANMNFLRVWGGGTYEDKAFYDACDECGICIWQDFMFACSGYPTFDDEFMKNVEIEAEQNICRIRHRACLALLCGNNELEQGLVGDGWTTTHMSWEDYGKLFDKMLPEKVAELSSGISYWPGSPHTPHGDRTDHRDPTCGDAHLWDVWHGRQPFEWYRTCEHRFNSEFGFQSFPEPKTVYGYTLPEDRNITSRIMEHHQRSGAGNPVIMHYMLDWFLFPKDFEMTLWLSQIQQGMAMKYAVEHWRRSMPRGMGTLYWQLNDNWPVASWSSIDYHGRWKALQYMAKKFFAPLLCSVIEDQEKKNFTVHITSDLLEEKNALVEWTITDGAGKVLREGKQEVKTPANASCEACTVEAADLCETHGENDILFWAKLSGEGLEESSNFASLAKPKRLGLSKDPGLKCRIVSRDGDKLELAVSSSAVALWSWVEIEGAECQYSDNFFHLLPDTEQIISVKFTSEKSDISEENIVVRSLTDTAM